MDKNMAKVKRHLIKNIEKSFKVPINFSFMDTLDVSMHKRFRLTMDGKLSVEDLRR